METPTRLPLPETMKPVSTAAKDPQRWYVKIGEGDTHWMDITYRAALQVVVLERCKAKMNAAESANKTLRAMEAMKNPAEFEIVQRIALQRVMKVEAPMTLAGVTAKGGIVVASFAAPDTA